MSGWEPVTIVSIVEGDGEVKALPKLLHRVAAQLSVAQLLTPTPMRIPRGKIVCAGGIERAADAAAIRVKGHGGVLVLLDADDDCPARLGPDLLLRARSVRSDIRFEVVLANREFEAWFLAAAASLAGQHGFREDLLPPTDPELPRDCKGWLTKQRSRGQPYKETVDQTALTSAFDLKTARENSPSFDKFCRATRSLLTIS